MCGGEFEMNYEPIYSIFFTPNFPKSEKEMDEHDYMIYMCSSCHDEFQEFINKFRTEKILKNLFETKWEMTNEK
jgi:uncharacterized membrane protein YheB (UPF0754 family)